MKVLLVNGGPHKNGCTNLALEEVSKILKEENIETEIIWIGNKPISGCIGCNSCLKNDNKCFMNDIVNEFIEKTKKSGWVCFWKSCAFCCCKRCTNIFFR